MPTVQLLKHPDAVCDFIHSLEVDYSRVGDELRLVYRIAGDLDQLRFSPQVISERADELWKHTCCELFVATDQADYLEFNFSPSTQWAAYQFDDYRSGMQSLNCAAPTILCDARNDLVEIGVALNVSAFDTLPSQAAMRMGFSCVIKDSSERISYWAVRHPVAKADFHHRDGFIISFPY